MFIFISYIFFIIIGKFNTNEICTNFLLIILSCSIFKGGLLNYTLHTLQFNILSIIYKKMFLTFSHSKTTNFFLIILSYESFRGDLLNFMLIIISLILITSYFFFYILSIIIGKFNANKIYTNILLIVLSCMDKIIKFQLLLVSLSFTIILTNSILRSIYRLKSRRIRSSCF